MKTRTIAIFIAAAVTLMLLLSGCRLPVPSSTGSLTVSISDGINARTLLPALSMDAASYTVSGAGPGGATFTRSTTTAGTLSIDGLAFGSWTITVSAYNAASTLIGQGTSTGVVVH